MAPRRVAHQNDGTIVAYSEKVVVTYKALVEFDGPNGKHYEVGEVFSGDNWPKGAIDSAALGGVLEKVEDSPYKVEDSVVFTEPTEVEVE